MTRETSLDEIERLRTDFLGLVSHELREPLVAIKGSVTTLLEEAGQLDPAEIREFHRIIVVEQAGHMCGLLGGPAGHGAHRVGHALGRARAL